jgi:hypothetical protein
MLILASISITKLAPGSALSVEQIRNGLNSYTLICRETKSDFMHVSASNSSNIHKALRMVNLAISENVYKDWYAHVESNLQCEQKERKDIEKISSVV